MTIPPSALRGLLLLLVVALLGGGMFLFIGWPRSYPKTHGVTWSVTYARYLGLDSLKGLEATLDELGVRHFRIPAYWSELERKEGVYDWKQLDQELGAIQKREGSVILVVGAKQPRWPECWYPDWVKTKTKEERKQAQLAYVRAVVERYREHGAVASWQIENEPTFFGSFGDCALFDPAILEEEVALVHELDPDIAGMPAHPRLTTASGELSSWTLPSKDLTGVGFSVYRVVVNDYFKRWSHWYLLPWFYSRKALLYPHGWVNQIFVSEFQMEPWVTGDMLTMSPDKMFHTFDLKQMKKNRRFAERIDVPVVYFWGVEWWYWMKMRHQHPEFWQVAKDLFAQEQTR